MSHVVLYYHIIWRTKRSEPTISEKNERELYAYIYGFCQRKRCTLIRINGMPDHIHMLISIRPDIAVSDFMQVLKTETSKWIKLNRHLFPLFDSWANGYAAFSYCERDKEMIRNYIMQQKEHHKHVSFANEYLDILKEWGIDSSTDYFLRDDK